MPGPLGPIVANAGLEVGRRVVGGMDDRRQRAAAAAAAGLEMARLHEEATQQLTADLGTATDPVRIQAIQEELAQRRNARTQELRAAERGKTTRRALTVGTVLALAAGGGWAGYRVYKDVKDAVVPDITVTTERTMRSALNSVEMRNDKIILTGTGDGEATVSTRAKIGILGIDVGLPEGLVGSKATVKTTRELEMVSHPGAVTLRPLQDSQDGSWDVLALVDPAKITTKLSGERPPAPDSSASSGILNHIGQVLGFNEGEQAKLYEDAETMAVNSFAASASRIVATPITVGATEANSIREGLLEASGAIPAGPVHDALVECAMGDVHIAYVTTGENGQKIFINPSDSSALYPYMSLPKPPEFTTIRVSAVEFTMNTTSPEQFLMSLATQEELTKIANQAGYDLVTDPNVVAPFLTELASQTPASVR